MEDIRTVLNHAARRLGLKAFVDRVHIVAIAAAALALLLVILSKALPLVNNSVNWMFVGPALALLAFAAAIAWWMPNRPSPLHVAVEVDQRLELKEKLSTAMLCRGREDAFAQAAIDDAIAVAKKPETSRNVRKRFAVAAPRQWWITPVLLAATVLTGAAVPAGDWFAGKEDQLTMEQKQRVEEIREQYEAAIKEAAEKSGKDPKELKDMLAEATPELAEPEAAKQPEQFQREAFKKLSALKDQLRKQTDTEQARALESLQNKLNKLDPSSDSGPTGDLSKALAKGDFSSAKKALDALQKQMEQGNLPDDQKKALADLAKQLEKLAQNQDAMKEQLKQAGIDPKAMENMEDLKKALAQAQNLTEEQKQQLAQAAQAAQQAAQAMQSMAGACQSMAGAQGEPGMQGAAGQEGMQGAQAMGDQLSQMEMMAQQLADLNAACEGLGGQCQGMGQGLGECNSQGQGISQAMAQMQWMQMQGNSKGPGMGKRGQGAGGSGSRLATKMSFTDEKQKVYTDPNSQIIGTTFIEGKQVIKGESQAKFAETVRAAESRAREDVEENLLPAQYEQAMKVYFGELQKRAEVVNEAPAPAPAETPAEEPEQ